MGASESYAQVPHRDEENDNEDDEDDDRSDHGDNETRTLLEQEEEGESYAQVSPYSTPQGEPSNKDSDRLVLPPAPSNIKFGVSLESVNNDRTITEIYLISHGECHMKLKPDLVGGRCPEAALTPKGQRQARALAVFLRSQGVRFNAIYTSPLDRARATAIPVCQEMNLPENMIRVSDALQDMSQGLWESCCRSDVYTPSVLSLMERVQPDFCAPSGETLRQVEFRMIQFLNTTVMCLPVNTRHDYSPSESIPPPPKLELPTRSRHGLPRRKTSNSRLQAMRMSGDQEADDEMTPRVPSKHKAPEEISESSVKNVEDNNNDDEQDKNYSRQTVASNCIGMFGHSVPIKCLVTGILGCCPTMSSRLCLEDSSITVLQHSLKMGWQIKRLNDTSHLRLM